MCAKLQLSQFVCEIHFQIYDLKMGPSEGGWRVSTKLLFYKYETIHFCSKVEFIFLWKYGAVRAISPLCISFQSSSTPALPVRPMALPAIAWQCVVVHCIAQYGIVLPVWPMAPLPRHCMVLHGIAWHCMALCGIVTPCPAYGLPCPLNKPQNPTQMHPLYSLHQHISLFRVQITTRRANPLHLL